MDIPAERWYQSIAKRRSRRRFEPKALVADALSHLTSLCNDFRPFDSVRTVVVTESLDKVFRGAIGPYGKISGAPAFIAFIGNANSPNMYEQLGYTGEGIILEAESMNLGTCWTAGYFHPKVVSSLVKLNKDERVLAITPVGYVSARYSLTETMMTGFGLMHRRKPLSDMVTGLPESEWKEWMRTALETARLAPSAGNSQPWKFKVEPESITVSVDNPASGHRRLKRICCGVTMLHIETGAMTQGIKGKWEFMEHPQVARFTGSQAGL